MVFIPAKERPGPRLPRLVAVEEGIHHHSYAVKRFRFENGSGKVIVYRFVNEQERIEREFVTSFRSDLLLYARLSRRLNDARDDEEFSSFLRALSV